ncbi:MAG TPA: dihydrodipicolinate synthase family protein, partial [Pilimelia sp.]|nr:dihydrodipicolinate synthase family protein [Pilimelia sp.]
RVAAAVAAGADAVLVAPPRFGPAPDAYFARVAEAAGGAPMLAYHWPGVAGGEVTLEALPGLPVAGLKDSSGDPGRLVRLLDLGWPGAVYTGSPALVGSAAWLGATGVLVATANAVPEDCLAAWDGDAAAQRRLLRTDLAARGGFARGIKEAMAGRFGTPLACRLA